MKTNANKWTAAVCRKFNIQNYSINPDGSIDVDGDVDIYSKGVTQLPFKFNKVTGDFDCRCNKLTSLDGSPKILGGSLYCSNNKLTALHGLPESISGNFNCGYNRLTSLEGGPKTVGGHYCCSVNNISDLVGVPESIGGEFICIGNYLTSTYSGDTDMEVIGDIIMTNASTDAIHMPEIMEDYGNEMELILKYQRHFFIWNDDLTLNEDNFKELIEEIEDGLL